MGPFIFREIALISLKALCLVASKYRNIFRHFSYFVKEGDLNIDGGI